LAGAKADGYGHGRCVEAARADFRLNPVIGASIGWALTDAAERLSRLRGAARHRPHPADDSESEKAAGKMESSPPESHSTPNLGTLDTSSCLTPRRPEAPQRLFHHIVPCCTLKIDTGH